MSIDAIIEFSKLVSLIVFVSAIGAQGWIAFLDIVSIFTKELERLRPKPSQDKFSRIAVIIGVGVVLMD